MIFVEKTCYYCKKKYPNNKALWVTMFCCVNCATHYKQIMLSKQKEGYFAGIKAVMNSYLGFDFVKKVNNKDLEAQNIIIDKLIKKNKNLTREEIISSWKEFGIKYKG